MKLTTEIVEQIIIDVISRSDMPQIKGNNIPNAVKAFKDYGVPFEYETVNISNLLPIQDNVSPEKVKNISDEIMSGRHMNPIFISNDNYIVDGHHRWLAYKDAKKNEIECIKIGYPKLAALKLFDRVSDKLEELKKYIGETIVKELENLDEKYLTSGKLFTAVRDLDDYNIKTGDRVKLTGTELDDGYFGIKNLRTNEENRIYSLEFIKNFK